MFGLVIGMSAAVGAGALPGTPAPAAASTPVWTTSPATGGSYATRQQRRAQAAVRFARKQIGDRYRWGGNGPSVWDCSGLIVGSWRKGGVRLPRTTQAIYRKVRKKVSYKRLRPGDVLFFYSGRGHAGIYVGKGSMIHAPSSGKRVRTVKLRGYYKRNFHGAVRPG